MAGAREKVSGRMFCGSVERRMDRVRGAQGIRGKLKMEVLFLALRRDGASQLLSDSSLGMTLVQASQA